MSLVNYRNKRDFGRTSEPAGKRRSQQRRDFCVQQHAASHMHFDFRLALDGVLKSWAVPKGPSLDPQQKRLAIEVEDHPLEYGDFEGIIPAGEYGGGTVMLWDRGRWQPDGDPHEGLRRGKLEFQLEGSKLRGGWVLVRSTALAGSDNTWLLIKRRDAEARPADVGDVQQQSPLSVKTGRDMEQIAAADAPTIGNGRKRKAVKRTVTSTGPAPAMTAGARRSKLPEVFDPQLATLARRAPEGDSWWHETKYDGYRIAMRIDEGQIDLLSRGMHSWTARLPHLVEAAKAIPVRSALLDGELVAPQKDGTTSFQTLQSAFKEDRVANLVYFAFDLLYLDGYDLTGAPLEARKEALAQVVSSGQKNRSPIRYAEHAVGHGPECFAIACKAGLEGIVSKRCDAPYRAGRGESWLKIQSWKEQEFVIAGYTEPEGARKTLGALLLGYYAGKKLMYAGRVGTGFSERTLAELGRQLKPLEQSRSPFSAELSSVGRAHWLKPTFVAQVQFSDWTRDGRLRQPSFQGLREDKDPREVVREEPIPTPAGTRAPSTTRNVAKRTAPDLAPLGVRFTHPDKVVYPDQGITKADLAKYYTAVADWMMPHIAGRPLTIVRCPDGIHRECFFQKHATQGRLEHLRFVPVKESGKTVKYLAADDLAGLLSLVQMGVLEFHVWGSRAHDLERPDRMIFDLDPDPSVPWSRVVQSTGQLKRLFDHLGLECFVKTTGGKGLHIVVPIARRHEWPEVSGFCRALAEAVVYGDPQRYTATSSKAARKGKIYIDYLRNKRGATSVAPYSTRARSGASVSIPIRWDELGAVLRPDQFNVENVPKRLRSLARDPWEGIGEVRQTITAAVKNKLKYS